MRRGLLCGLVTAVGLGAATVAVATGQTTDAEQSPAPDVAIDQLREAWNRVEVDYGVVAGDTATLVVEAPDGGTETVDTDNGQGGTLTWDRLMAGEYVPLGRYRLTVVARGPGGESNASTSIDLGLLYALPPTVRRTGVAVRYHLAEAASVVMRLRLKNGTFAPVERRTGIRGANRITWDLRLQGKRVPAGRYVLQLVATSRSGAVSRITIGGGRA